MRPMRTTENLRALVRTLCVTALAAMLFAGVARARQGEIVVYSSADEAVLTPLVEAFSAKTGTKVRVERGENGIGKDWLFDTLTKGGAKADAVVACDAVQAARLALAGVLEGHEIKGSEIPATMRDAQARWHGFGARARVFVYHGDKPPSYPHRDGDDRVFAKMRDLWHPNLSKSVFVMTQPEGGTMGSHLALLWTMWERPEARKWDFQMARQKVRLVNTDAEVVGALASGEALGGMTDADDVARARAAGADVGMTLLIHDKHTIQDELEKEFGVVLLPHAAGVARGAANAQGAQAFVEFVVSAEAAKMLAESASRLAPVIPSVAERFPDLTPAKVQPVDFTAAAQVYEEVLSNFREAMPG